MQTDRLREYADLRTEIKELEAKVKELRKTAENIEGQLLNDFANEGVQRMTVDGKTLYLRREVWARRHTDVDSTDMAQALMGSERFADLVSPSVNMQSLSARVREYVQEEEDLPPEVERVVRVDEVFRLGVRSS